MSIPLELRTYLHNKHLVHDGKCHETMEQIARILQGLRELCHSTNTQFTGATISFDGMTWFWGGHEWWLKPETEKDEKFVRDLIKSRKVNDWPRAEWVE